MIIYKTEHFQNSYAYLKIQMFTITVLLNVKLFNSFKKISFYFKVPKFFLKINYLIILHSYEIIN